VGASGTTNFQGLIDSDEYVTNLKPPTLYTTVDKMRWSDASVQAALLMCELPIRSAEWDIEPASEDAQDVEIAEFVKENMFDGLAISWEDTLRQILLMHPFGCMVLEIIYKLTEDGKIGWRKWAPRLPKTIVRWNTDKNGELKSVVQRTYKNDSYKEIKISIQKLMVFVHRREGDNYLGTSILRQAYKHWFFRDKYYKIDAVAQERSGIGIPNITLPPSFSTTDYDEAKELGENLRGHEKAYVIKKEGWEVEMMDLKASSMKDPKEMLEHHTREILKSVLAQFIELGSGSVGSYSLSEDQSKMFLSSLDAKAKAIEDTINKEIVKLVDYNWNVDKYPKLVHADLGVKNVKDLSEAIQALTFAGVLTADPELEDYMRKVLKLPDKTEENRLDTEDYQKEDKDKPEDDAKKASEKFAYHRPFTKVEMRVQFDEINDFMDRAESELIRILDSILFREKTRLMPAFEVAIANKDFKAVQRLSWNLKGQYAQKLRGQIKKIFEFGKLKASHEVSQSAPSTDTEVKDRLTKRSIFLSNYQEKQMMDNLKKVASDGMLSSKVTDSETLSSINKAFDTFISKNVPTMTALVTSEEINNGRKLTFDAVKKDIYGFQWSAILDGATCNYCTSMDGRIISTENRAFSSYKPGAVHFHCRCIWVAIMKEETNPPPFTGIPKQLRPQSQIPPWNFEDLSSPLPGSGKRKVVRPL